MKQYILEASSASLFS